eukprot:c2049_g1_i1 orf=191-1276(+)
MERRDVVSWSMMIAGCVENGQPKIALEYFKQMQDEMVRPNYVTLISVLKACAHLAFLKEGQLVHVYIIEDDILVELNVISALIDMYSKCGQIGDAYQVFHSSATKDVVLWTAMISGYVQQGFNEEALELFAKMLISGVEANMVTFVSVLCACACMVAIKQGTHIHEQICKSGLDTSVEVCAALTNMYSKCGLLEDARRIFDLMPAHSVITWTTMVTAYAQHGHGKEALQLVDEMRQKNMKLDHVSLVGVIAACNNEGLVHEASHLVDSMCKDYGFVPSTKHYACMADALGRAGQLKEAESMLKSMPFQPNAVSWRSYLGAWKNHEGSKPAEVFAFEPRSADDFVLLSNVYCAAAEREEYNK